MPALEAIHEGVSFCFNVVIHEEWFSLVSFLLCTFYFIYSLIDPSGFL